MIKKNKKGFETIPVIRAVVLIMIGTLLSIGLVNVFNVYKDFQINSRKVEMESLFYKLMSNALTGEGIMTDARIKRNIYVLKNGSSTIDVYAYREIFETNPGTNQILSTPKLEFDRFYKIPLSSDNDLKIVFLSGSKLDIDRVDKIGIQIDRPNGEILVFKIDDNFREMTAEEMNMAGSEDQRIKMFEGLKKGGRKIPNNYYIGNTSGGVKYGMLISGCFPPLCIEYEDLDIGIQYKRSIIGYLNINKKSKKIKFISFK